MHIDSLPTLDTKCRVCGEVIRYLRYKYSGNDIVGERRAPVVHNGHCRAVWEKERAVKKVRLYNKRRK